MSIHASMPSHTLPPQRWTVSCRRKDIWLPSSGRRLYFLDCWSLITIMSCCKTKKNTLQKAAHLLQMNICCKNCYRLRLLDMDIRHKPPQTCCRPPLIYSIWVSSCPSVQISHGKNKAGQWIDRLSCGFVKSVLCLFCQVSIRAQLNQCVCTKNTDMSKEKYCMCFSH